MIKTYKQIGKQKLRMGYTTGSCAAAAAKAAAQMLFSGVPLARVSLMTPKGIGLDLEVEDIQVDGTALRVPKNIREDGMSVLDPAVSLNGKSEAAKAPYIWKCVSCAVRKDAGDDPDVTNGVLVYAKVSLPEARVKAEEATETESAGIEAVEAEEDIIEAEDGPLRKPEEATDRIRIDGGIGIGRVTKKGLEQPVGAAAINRVPRQMIREAVAEICEEQEYGGCLDVLISIPAGVELAKKTFNPNLGIEGGISVLGTSGIVEPMSEEALKESIRVEMRMLAENHGRSLIFTPGNYGMHYITDRWPALAGEDSPCLKFSNYVGDVIRFAQELELESVLFVAHIGKFVKVAGGIMNTHSKEADARLEILASAALRAGASAECARQILDCATTDAAIDMLAEVEKSATADAAIDMPASDSTLLQDAMQIVLEKALYHLRRKAGDETEIGLVLFSNAHGTLAESENVDDLLERIQAGMK